MLSLSVWLPLNVLVFTLYFHFVLIVVIILFFLRNLGRAWFLVFTCDKSQCKTLNIVSSVVCASMRELTTADFEGLVVR